MHFPILKFVVHSSSGHVRASGRRPVVAPVCGAHLHKRTGKLTRLYTQNIDGLDYQCELPSDKIVAVHGSIGRVACEGCVIVQQCLRCWEYSLGVVCGGGVGLT